MALSASGLANAIDAALNTRLPIPTQRGASSADRTALATAIAEAVVTHITTNAVVTGVCPSMGGPLASGRVT